MNRNQFLVLQEYRCIFRAGIVYGYYSFPRSCYCNGEYIESFDDLKDVLNLSQFQLDKIKGYIIINYDSKKSRKKTNQKDSKKKKINDFLMLTF